MRSFWKSLRLASAVLLLGALFWIVDFHQLLAALASIRLCYVVYLLLLSVALIAVSCVKWQRFVRGSGHQVDLLSLMKWYTMAYFFNMFFPSSVGGDVARSVQLGHRVKSHQSAFAATLAERFTGFLSMTLLGVFFVAVGSKATGGVEAAILSVSFITLSAALVLFSEGLSRFCAKFGLAVLRRIGLRAAADKLEPFANKVLDATEFLRNDRSLFVAAIAYSLLFHLLAVVNVWVAALAVGWDQASFGSLCIVVPLVLLVAVAPVTPNAIGIQEGAFVFFLVRVGATEGQALGLALVLRAKNLITALVGGLLYLAESRSKTHEPEAAA